MQRWRLRMLLGKLNKGQMGALLSLRRKYVEASKGLDAFEEILAKMIPDYERWSFVEDSFEPLWTFDKKAVYKRRFWAKDGKIREVNVEKDGDVMILEKHQTKPRKLKAR